MRLTKKDLSRVLFHNISPFKLILHGICIGVCLLPAIVALVIGLVVFVTSPNNDDITVPTDCTIMSTLQCITTTASTSRTLFKSSHVVLHREATTTIETNNATSIHPTASPVVAQQCTYTVSFPVSSHTSSSAKIVRASTLPFAQSSPYANYSLSQVVPCFYDEDNTQNVSFTSVSIVHFYTILGLAVIGGGASLLFLVLLSMTIFFINLFRFCVGHSRGRKMRQRNFRKNLMSLFVRTSQQVGVNGDVNDHDDSSPSSTIGSEHEPLTPSSSKGYYSTQRSGLKNSSSAYLISSALSSAMGKKAKTSFVIDEKHFYQDQQQNHSDDEENTLTSDSVEDVSVEIVSTPSKSSYPYQSYSGQNY